MATFATSTVGQSVDLAGPMSDFVGRFVALRRLGKPISVSTEYGASQALRVQVVDLIDGRDGGIRLLFWSTIRDAVNAVNDAGIDWAIGTITHEPQKNDPTRSVYLLAETPFDPEEVSDILDRFPLV